MRSLCFLLVSLVLVACNAPETQVETDPPEEPVKISKSNSKATSCLAEAIYFEARGTGKQGRRAVAHVVVNRAESPEFPNSVCGVVADKCQFSYRCDGHSDVLASQQARTRAHQTAEQVLSGAPDITSGALFFHSARMEPGWFATRPRVGQFGGNIFYR